MAIQWAAMDLMKAVHLVSSLVEQSVEKLETKTAGL